MRHRVITIVSATALLIASSARAQPTRASASTDFAGTMVDVDGRRMRVYSSGVGQRVKGAPVVVLEAGAGNALEVWREVIPAVARFAPVVAYDRSGLGKSEWDGQAPTPQHVNAKLRKLLQRIGAEPPYVLVGYSWGGALMQYFAGQYGGDVAALVLVDPGPMITATRAELQAPFDSVGAGRAGFEAYWSAVDSFFTRGAPGVRAELDVVRGLLDVEPSKRGLRRLPDVPIVALVAAKYLPLPMKVPYDPRTQFDVETRQRIRIVQEWTLASPHGTVVVTNQSTHAVPREDPELIVWAVRRALESVRRLP